MYAVRQADENRLSLDEFTVEDQKTGQKATLGQELTSTDFPAVKVKIRSIKGENKTAQIQIIRNGVLAKQESVSLPYELTWRDVGNKQEGRAYYRVKALINSTDHLVSNPIFVKFSDAPGEVVASLPPPKPEPTPAPRMKKPSPAETKPPTPAEMPKISGAKTESLLQPASIPEVSTPVVQHPTSPTQPVPPTELRQKALSEIARNTVDPKKLLKVMVDGVHLRKGPSTIFPKIISLKKGSKLEFVRRTNIELNNKNWLVVKRGNRSAYVWEGVVGWVEARPIKMEK
tara:strand:- start:160 stop:1020 length:861 start_codon:yes stop_codon:yes gene_type:complete